MIPGMPVTDNFFKWFFIGLGGLGGWFLFLLFAVAAIIWMLYDSNKRRLPAFGWKLATMLTAALILPAIIYRFASFEVQTSLLFFLEAIFYLGVLGGILPVVLAVAYFITFQGVVGSPMTSAYAAPQPPYIPPMPPQVPVQRQDPYAHQGGYQAPMAPPPQIKPKSSAWVISEDNHTYQLNQGETTIGRGQQNDIQLMSDTTLSRHHVKIIEQGGRFRLVDLGSANGSQVNGRRVREPVLLEPDDTIKLGDHTTLRFVTTRR